MYICPLRIPKSKLAPSSLKVFNKTPENSRQAPEDHSGYF